MRPNRLLSQLAVLSLLSVGIAVGMPRASVLPGAASHPVAPRDTFVSLVAPSRVPGAKALAAADRTGAASRARSMAHSSARSSSPLSAPDMAVTGASVATAVPAPVVVVGVTWQQGTGQGVSVQYRSQQKGRWSAWSFVDADPAHGPDPGSAEAKNARAGSDPLVVTNATAVQVRTLGDGAHAPAQPKLMVVDPGASAASPSAADPSVAPAMTMSAASTALAGSTTSLASLASASRPVIYTRAQWGADERLRRAAPEYGAVKGAFIHHTVNANSYSSSQVPKIIRAIYAYHVNGRGWDDIGYNFLIDRFGRTWEGRYGGIDRAVIGAHTLDHNAYSFGASAIGNFEVAAVPSAVTSAFIRLIAWKAQVHQFTPAGISNISGDTLNSVSGHRNAFATTCPGRYLYAKLPAIRSGAGAIVRGLPSLSINRDVDNHNHGDVLATNSNNDLLFFSGSGNGTMTGPSYLSHGAWVGVDLVTIAGDWDGKGAVDMVARRVSTGQLLLYRGNGLGGFRAALAIGAGWSGFDALVAPGDVTGDGHPDLIARTRDGKLRLYPGNGRGGFGVPRVVGVGWSGMAKISAMGDWTGDGYVDLIAVDSSGVARIYPGAGAGRFGAPLLTGPGWDAFTSISAIGDETNDTRTDLFAVDLNGVGWIGKIGRTAGSVVWVKQSADWVDVSVYGG